MWFLYILLFILIWSISAVVALYLSEAYIEKNEDITVDDITDYFEDGAGFLVWVLHPIVYGALIVMGTAKTIVDVLNHLRNK